MNHERNMKPVRFSILMQPDRCEAIEGAPSELARGRIRKSQEQKQKRNHYGSLITPK